MTDDATLLAGIQAWILDRATSEKRPKALRCAHFLVNHVPDPTVQHPITSDIFDLNLKTDAQKRDEAARIASAFFDAIKVWGAGSTVSQLFVVAASVSASAHPIAQHPVRITPEPAEPGTIGFMEPASEIGQRAQQMRLTEVMHKMFLDGNNKNSERMMRIMEDSLKQAKEERDSRLAMDERHMAVLLQMQELLDRKTSREFEVLKGTVLLNRDERMHQFFESTLAQLVPKIADRLGAGPMSELLRGMKHEEIMILCETLDKPRREKLIEACVVHLPGFREKLLAEQEKKSLAQAAANGTPVAVVQEESKAS